MIEFNVGDKHENMKGLYEVISIHGDSMVIKWESGETTTTPMETQRRIIQRMQNERQEISQNKVNKKQKKVSSSFHVSFKGFQDFDFKDDVTGTTWRRRDGLGGAVTRQLDSDKFKFNSWAIYACPLVHWGDVGKRTSRDPWFLAKFIASVDAHNLYYGLHLEHSVDAIDNNDSWDSFLKWLKIAGNEDLLCETLKTNDLFIFSFAEQEFQGTIKPDGTKWLINDSEGFRTCDSLYLFLDNLSRGKWIGLHIGTIEKKVAVVEKGNGIADDISKVFQVLMPFFEAASNHY